MSTLSRIARAGAALIVVAAIAVRAVLALLGGQFYSSDEAVHFIPGVRIADALLDRGDWREALTAAIQQEHHIGFRIPSALVVAVAKRVGRGQHWLLAFLLSFSSVAVIVLVGALARRLGAGGGEALAAMLFAATASSLTYFARHMDPYDTGLAIDLLALWLALRGDRNGTRRWWRGAAVGAVACFGFLTYYSYFAVAAVACVVYVLRRRAGVVPRAVGVAMGAALVFLPFEIASLVWGPKIPVVPYHVALWRSLHGAPESWGSSYAEGWWVPWAYLWGVEHLVLLIWIGLAIAGCVAAVPRARWWAAIVVALYGWLALHSTILHESVVLGRFVRQMVPFLCLGAAAGLAAISAAARRRAGRIAWSITVAGAMAAYALLVTSNLRPVFAQRFPAELDHLWIAQYGPLAYAQTITGPGGTAGSTRYVAYNVRAAGPPWPIVGLGEPMVGCVLEAYPHPVAWPGYQFEGYRESGRAAIRARPYLMAIVDSEASEPCPLPGGRSEQPRRGR